MFTYMQSIPLQLFSIFLCSKIGIFVLTITIKQVLRHKPRIHSKYTYEYTLFDITCILINSCFVETYFLYKTLIFTQQIEYINIQTPITALLTYVIDDKLYTAYHFILHSKPIYKYIHAFHHKIITPYNGYVHGIMEHPLEMIGALFIHFTILQFVHSIFTLSKFAVLAHIIVKAIIAILNHSDKIIHSHSIKYSSFAHTLHHVKRRIHYGQHEFTKLSLG